MTPAEDTAEEQAGDKTSAPEAGAPEENASDENASEENASEENASDETGLRGRVARLRGTILSGAAGLSAGARRGVLLGLVAALVLGVVAAGLLGRSVRREATVRATADAALTAARTDTETLLTIAPDTADADLARAKTFTAEPFASQFQQNATEVMLPAIKAHRLLTTTKVSRAALISSGPDRAEALVYITQYSSPGDGPIAKPTIISSQVKEVLVKVGDRWLISEFQVL